MTRIDAQGAYQESASVASQPAALYVSPTIPDPTGAGAQQRSLRNLLALTRRFVVDVVVMRYGSLPDDVLPNVRTVVCLPRSLEVDPEGRPAPARAGPSRIPFVKLLREWLADGGAWTLSMSGINDLEALRGRHYGPGFFFRLTTAGLAPILEGRYGVTFERKVLDLDDIDSKRVSRAARVERIRSGREQTLLNRLEARRLRRWETTSLKKFDSTLVCSEGDRKELLRRVPGAKVAVLPNSVAVGQSCSTAGEDGCLIFVGGMAYGPNADAAIFFCEKVLPRLRQQTTFAPHVWLVGPNPPERVASLAKIDGVYVTGRVETVRPYYERAQIAVVPIRYGGGTRIKILEALALGRPVVSTTIGAEGLELEPGRDILIADDPDDFARCCADLLADPARREELARNGRRVVERLYSHEAVSAKLLGAVAPELSGVEA